MIDIEKAKDEVKKFLGRDITEKEVQTVDAFGRLMTMIWSDTNENDKCEDMHVE